VLVASILYIGACVTSIFIFKQICTTNVCVYVRAYVCVSISRSLALFLACSLALALALVCIKSSVFLPTHICRSTYNTPPLKSCICVGNFSKITHKVGDFDEISLSVQRIYRYEWKIILAKVDKSSGGKSMRENEPTKWRACSSFQRECQQRWTCGQLWKNFRFIYVARSLFLNLRAKSFIRGVESAIVFSHKTLCRYRCFFGHFVLLFHFCKKNWVCVCVYICIYICIYIYTYIYIYVYVYIYNCVYKYIYIYKYLHIHICIYIYLYIDQYT